MGRHILPVIFLQVSYQEWKTSYAKCLPSTLIFSCYTGDRSLGWSWKLRTYIASNDKHLQRETLSWYLRNIRNYIKCVCKLSTLVKIGSSKFSSNECTSCGCRFHLLTRFIFDSKDLIRTAGSLGFCLTTWCCLNELSVLLFGWNLCFTFGNVDVCWCISMMINY